MAQVETRGHRGWRACTLLVALSCAVPWSRVAAQGAVRVEDIGVGSEAERYLRALSVLGASPSWSLRPVVAELHVEELIATAGPWRVDTTRLSRLRVQRPAMDLSFNSGLPSTTIDDGSAWAGRGLNARGSVSLEYATGPIRIRLAPLLWIAQNQGFELVPTSGVRPWQDPVVPAGMDLPQRFGTERVARLDPGASTIEWRTGIVRVALTSSPSQIGPAPDHALVLQGGAGGIPRLEVSTPHPVRTRVGDFGGVVAWGRTPHTAWANDRRSGALFTSYLAGTWRPAFVPTLELGVLRLTHRDWARMSLRELLVPFGSVYAAAGGSYETEFDNQLASVFATLRVPAAGLAFFGEFGKNDRSAGWRDQAQEPEHSAAWLLGMQKTWRDGSARLWALSATAVSGSVPGISRLRGLAHFYEHSRLTQGHTLRGQLLGTPLLQREGGAEVRVDRYDATGRLGVVLATRSLPNELAEAIAPEHLRQEWSIALDGLRWTRRGAWRARVGAVADLGYSPVTGDAFNLHLSLGRDFW